MAIELKMPALSPTMEEGTLAKWLKSEGDEIVAGETPLGRVLINHNVLRHIDLGAILRVTAGDELAGLLKMPSGGVTYGRLATIFCNQHPAVDLLEISAPLEAGESTDDQA